MDSAESLTYNAFENVVHKGIHDTLAMAVMSMWLKPAISLCSRNNYFSLTFSTSFWFLLVLESRFLWQLFLLLRHFFFSIWYSLAISHQSTNLVCIITLMSYIVPLKSSCTTICITITYIWIHINILC